VDDVRTYLLNEPAALDLLVKIKALIEEIKQKE